VVIQGETRSPGCQLACSNIQSDAETQNVKKETILTAFAVSNRQYAHEILGRHSVQTAGV